MPIELPVPLPLFNDSDFEAQIHDPVTGDPVTVIRREDAWFVRCTWYLQGPLVDSISGTWHLSVGLESIGSGPELTSPAVSVAYTSGTRTGAPGSPGRRISYTADVNFAALAPNTDPAPAESIPYKGAAVLTFRDPAGTPGPFAAVYELPMLQIFDSPVLPNN
jgi:hypothetical protein